jgi:isoquinoline 1-oxidoreductase subunit beta
MRIAGAQARRVLIDAVAAKWGVPAAELSTEPSVVVHQASSRRISYGEIAAFAKAPAELPKIEDNDLKPAANFRLIGKDVPRVEVPLKVTGAAKYAIDAQVPGMVYAAVLQSPYPGGRPEAVDETRARQVAGITDIVKLPEGVGVVGTSVEATQAAKNLLKVTWSDAPGAHLDSERALEEFAVIGRDKSRDGVPYEAVGDAKTAMRSAAKVYRGEYRTRYIYHAQMEPVNATAAVSADGKSVEIWAGTQGPTNMHDQVARLLQTERANITLHQHFLGGGYGRRSQNEVIVDAVRLAKAVGKPVKLIWTREDDLTGGKFRPMTAHQGFDAGGKLVAWHHRVIAESVAAYTSGAPDPTAPRTDRVVMKGSPIPQYPIPNKLAEHVIEARGARLAAFRGVGNAHNAFAAESFLDEIAKDRGLDPIAFRLMLSEGQPRMQTLLRAVAEMSDWKKPRDGRGLGIGTMVKDDTLAAGVAEVSVDRATGKVKVHNFWAAIDAGLAVQQCRGANRGQHHLRPRPRAAREDHHQEWPCARVQLQRLRSGADVGRAQYRGEGGVHRQSPHGRRRGRRAGGRLRGRQRRRGADRRAPARIAVRAGACARRPRSIEAGLTSPRVAFLADDRRMQQAEQSTNSPVGGNSDQRANRAKRPSPEVGTFAHF